MAQRVWCAFMGTCGSAAPETGVKRIVYDADSSTINGLTMSKKVGNDLETTHTILLAAMSSPVTNAGCAR